MRKDSFLSGGGQQLVIHTCKNNKDRIPYLSHKLTQNVTLKKKSSLI